MRVLITGAAGFIGANVTAELVRRQHEVTLLTRRTTDLWRLDQLPTSTLTIIPGDLASARDVHRAVTRASPECIIHCATRGAYPLQTDLLDIAMTDVIGFANLLTSAAAINCPHLINTGSSSEYGTLSAGPRESSPVSPNSVYSASKAWATCIGQQALQSCGQVVTTLRLYSVYGFLEDPSRLVPRICAYGLRGTLPPLASPTIVRDFVWIGDVVEAYRRVVELGPPASCEVYNVGSGRETRLDEVAAVASRVFGIAEQPNWNTYPPRAWETGRWFADTRKIQHAFGWSAGVDLTDGLTYMRDWLRHDRAMLSRYVRAAQ